ncbi:DUF4382 domain-containing protein [Chloroflexota bacterium]
MIKVRLLTGIMLLSLLTVMLGGCVLETDSEPSSETTETTLDGSISETTSGGTINVYVTDAPPSNEVTSIVLTVVEVRVHRASAEQEMEQEQEQSSEGDQTQEQEWEQEQDQSQDNGGEWITIDISEDAATFDLLEIKGVEQYLGTNQVEVGKYTQVRLVVDKIMVAFDEGELEEADVSSGELKIVRSFDVIAGEAIALVLDFDADRMVTVTGAGKIKVKPVIKLTVKKDKGQSGEKPGEEENGDEQPSADMLGYTIWILHSYGEPENLKDIIIDTEITAEFVSSEGTVKGSAGCNSYFGSYELEDSQLSVPGPVGATEMYCGNPEGIMDQEQEYLAILQLAESYEIDGDELRINCGSHVLVFGLE